MTTAIISDIHGNIDALQVVFADIDKRGIHQVVCLGDIIGYGPNPCECLDMVMQRCQWSLMGNHDFSVLYEPTNFNLSAEQAAFWTRRQLELETNLVRRRARWKFLGDLRIRENYNGILCVHASPIRPINEYIFSDDVVTAPSKLTQIFEKIDQRCLVGHTHVCGVITNKLEFHSPDDVDGSYQFGNSEKCIVNPGSVGQPRDRDPRASYAILYDDRVEFVRLQYPVYTVIEKLSHISDLSSFLGERLLEGR